MIILPHRHEPRSRLLVPMRAAEWRQPSQRASLDGVETQTRFRLTARANDGAVLWRGWFDDRDDADAFLWALARGSLPRERELWTLPVPMWCPDVGPDLAYDFATVTFLTSTSASNQTYTVPVDWSNTSNSIECVGSGGGSGKSNRYGGGGGGYSKATNITLTLGGTATYHLEAGGAGSSTNGTTGGDCWFNGATLGAASVGAKGGSGGTTASGTGGASASGVGSTKTSGGNGGAGNSGVSDSPSGGGGGAGGPNGNGNNGSQSTTAYVGGNGGSGDAGSGGSGGAGSGGAAGAGGNGTEFDASHGCGGGGGGSGMNNNGGAGGNYGGGAGGNVTSGSAIGGSGAQGLIVLTYTPVMRLQFNMSMLGM